MFDKFSELFSTIPSGPLASWVVLLIAGVFEVGWVYALKMTNGYTHFWWTMATIPLALVSAGLLASAMRGIPMGTAYTVWTGMGTVGSVVLGILLFSENVSPLRLLCIALIVLGVLGLKFGQGSGSLS